MLSQGEGEGEGSAEIRHVRVAGREKGSRVGRPILKKLAAEGRKVLDGERAGDGRRGASSPHCFRDVKGGLTAKADARVAAPARVKRQNERATEEERVG